MKTYYATNKQLDQYIIKHNLDYLGNFFPGSLQDNFILFDSDKNIYVYEHYLNPWESNLKIIIPENEEEDNNLYDEFTMLENKYYEEYKEV